MEIISTKILRCIRPGIKTALARKMKNKEQYVTDGDSGIRKTLSAGCLDQFGMRRFNSQTTVWFRMDQNYGKSKYIFLYLC
jgi:hypothetical protein